MDNRRPDESEIEYQRRIAQQKRRVASSELQALHAEASPALDAIIDREAAAVAAMLRDVLGETTVRAASPSPYVVNPMSSRSIEAHTKSNTDRVHINIRATMTGGNPTETALEYELELSGDYTRATGQDAGPWTFVVGKGADGRPTIDIQRLRKYLLTLAGVT
jgi:hypothetical protein